MSHNAVLSIAQDKKGFIWLGTGYGLNRFDGQHFKQYVYDAKDTFGLSNNYIIALLCDTKGRLWIGNSVGLELYNEQKDNFVRIPIPALPKHPQSTIVSTLYEDKSGNLWIGTFDGLFQINKNNPDKCVAFPYTNQLAGTNIRTIIQDEDANIWIGTTTGLTKISFTDKGMNFKTFRHEKDAASSLPGNFINSLAEDHAGNIWIGTQDNGVCMYQSENDTFQPLQGIAQNEHIRKIFIENNGDLWIGTQDGLLNYVQENKKVTRYTHNILAQNTLSQNSIYSIFSDNNGSLWIGTYFGGVNIINNYNTPFFDFTAYFHTSGDLFNDVVSGMTEDRNQNLWIGTEGGGLHKVNLQTGKSETFTNQRSNAGSLGSNNIKTVYCDNDGNIWIGTHGGGLNLYKPEENSFEHFLFNPNDAASSFMEIASVLDDGKQHLWVGTHSGLYIFDRTNKQLSPSNYYIDTALRHTYIRTLSKDSYGNIWIGTAYGTYLHYGGSHKYTKITSYAANSIAEAGDGNIWLALNNFGLGMYSYKTGLFQSVAALNNFGGRNIIGILPDDKNNSLWLSTDRGIIEYNLTNHSQRIFTKKDGLINENFNYNSFVRSNNNEMLFGGIRGITVFQPDKIEINKTVSPIVFTEFKLLDSIINVGNNKDDILQNNILNTQTLHLNHDQNVFTISYALLNFIRPGKNHYAYKLDGFNQNWIQTSATSATFTNVPPGKYTFEVKGANNDGIWGKPILLTIDIASPFWRTWWAYLVYLLVLSAVGFMIIRYFFLREILKKEETLHQNKLNFFTNISHEIRTHLTLIITPLEQVIVRNNLDKQDAQQIEKVKKNSSRLLTLVNELMDFRKVESGSINLYVTQYNIVELLEDIVASFEETAQERMISMQIVYNNPDIPLYFDKNQITKVFVNLISNAFKYTQSGGRICINIEEDAKEVTIQVCDNGMGIKEEFIEKIFNNFYQVADMEMQNTGYGVGLAMCKSIIELHKGEIHVQSIPASKDAAGETRFHISLQKGLNHLSELPYIIIKNEKNLTSSAIVATNEKKISTPLSGKQSALQLPCVLIIEDNDELRELLKETFAGTYRLLEASNGEDGVDIAMREIPDIVISDVMMPKMDGFSVCTTLKEDEKTSHIPIILLTAKNTQTDHINGLENGADIYLTKPFSTQVLLLSVKNILSSRERMRRVIYEKITSPEVAVAKENSIPELGQVDEEFLAELITIVNDNMNKDGFGVGVLSRKAGMSPPILYKKLFAVTGLTVNDFIKSQKMKKSAQLLLETRYGILEIADTVGYKDAKYFSNEFKKYFGISPKGYREKYHV
ncbi:hypothetical protein A9P82_04350 [Arachidicoccus ginsenosidimutans]|uniref:hybrid sensor histidine kinase/response regulator transcription factor n=1 Tax=Arachidicoccus sp. BS20 TaxID=1850526 RepID=UPI0007F0A9C7|nr:two-component regulator propeller domain-containing protein [Arachidicoccus sp. BS20]ANI88587.1 hypothetical protein A9P82_04350 [Arachidicoccus sp. BS20]